MGEGDVLDLLRAANPVTAKQARALRLEPLGVPGAGGDPERPGRGALRSRHLGLALAFAVPAIVVLLVATAFGVGRNVLPFVGGEKAPPRVVLEFASMSTGAPPGMDPRVIASQTRRVGTWYFGGKSHTLWVAPTRAGGFCFMWTRAGGGCEREGTVPIGQISGAAPVRLSKEQLGRAPEIPDGKNIPIWVTGHASAKYVASAEIRFEDGAVVRPNITWVSKPINAGFFAYDVPAGRRVVGRRAVSVAGLDSNGKRVAEDFLGVGTARPEPLRDAVMSDRHAELGLDTRHGKATIYTAPTRYEGHCLFLNFEGKDTALYPCLPSGYGYDNLAALRFVPTSDDVIVAGPAPARLHTVELRFADGDSIVLRPRQGFFLYELPARHLTADARATEWIGRDRNGATILTIPFAKLPDPCYGPLPLRPGEHCRFGF
jgi:hypothetical protein